jgi:hypothetical protein
MEKEVYKKNDKTSQNTAEHEAQVSVEMTRHQCNGEAILQKDSRE